MYLPHEMEIGLRDNTITEFRLCSDLERYYQSDFNKIITFLEKNTSISTLLLADVNFDSKRIEKISDVIRRVLAKSIQSVVFLNNEKYSCNARYFELLNDINSQNPLYSLSFIFWHFSYQDAADLSSFLKKNNTLRYIALRAVSLQYKSEHAREFEFVFKALKSNSVLEKLEVTDTFLNTRSMDALKLFLCSNRSVLTLTLTNCDLKGNSASYISAVLKNNDHLVSLSLSDNKFKSEALVMIFDTIKENTVLRRLNFAGIKDFDEKSVTSLIRVLEINQTLAQVDLSDSNIGIDAVKLIGEALFARINIQSFNISNSVLKSEESALRNFNDILLHNKLERDKSNRRRVFINAVTLLFYFSEAQIKCRDFSYDNVVLMEDGSIELQEIRPSYTDLLPPEIWIRIIEHLLELEFPEVGYKILQEIVSRLIVFSESFLYSKSSGYYLKPKFAAKPAFHFFKTGNVPFRSRHRCERFIDILSGIPIEELCENNPKLKEIEMMSISAKEKLKYKNKLFAQLKESGENIHQVLSLQGMDSVSKTKIIISLYRRDNFKLPLSVDFKGLLEHLQGKNSPHNNEQDYNEGVAQLLL